MEFKFESNTQEIKYKVLKEAANIGFHGIQDINKEEISEKIIPGPKPQFRCCIHKERAIIKERLSYALNEKDTNHIIKVIDEACDQCPINRYTVTDSCRGCIAQSCKNTCPVDAIYMVGGRAYINQQKCIECGKCKKACQFNAISDTQRPCRRACPVDAIEMDENKTAKINYDKCISCGHCAYNCPFGSITDVSYILNVAEGLSQNKSMYALVAPAISSQFDNTTIGQITHALKKIGFKDVIEVALGADMIIKEETEEYIEHSKTHDFMTTSCCPAFVGLIENEFPSLVANMSTTVSPMIALGRFVKSLDKNSTTVFIGPCMAKKAEAKRPEIEDAIDYVITFEELRALLGAKDIDIADMPVGSLDNASFFGRMFPVSGGVSSAIQEYILSEGYDAVYKPVKGDGAMECKKILKQAKLKKLDATMIEGMICESGCIGGPGSITHRKKDAFQVKKYAQNAKEKTTKDSLQVIDTSLIHLHKAKV